MAARLQYASTTCLLFTSPLANLATSSATFISVISRSCCDMTPHLCGTSRTSLSPPSFAGRRYESAMRHSEGMRDHRSARFASAIDSQVGRVGSSRSEAGMEVVIAVGGGSDGDESRSVVVCVVAV